MATLIYTAVGGLQVDLLATNVRDRIDAAFRELLRMLSGPPRSTREAAIGRASTRADTANSTVTRTSRRHARAVTDERHLDAASALERCRVATWVRVAYKEADTAFLIAAPNPHFR
jgi:hypothetical protein